MNHKGIDTTARSPSVGADGGQLSKTYTSISAETADRLHSDLSLKPRRTTMPDGSDDCDDAFGGGVLSSHRRGGKESGDESTFWNKVNTESKPIV